MAPASTVGSDDAECVLSVRCEGLNLSGGGGHRVFSEEAIGGLDSYDVFSRPGRQAEIRHQGRAVLRLHRLDGIRHLRGWNSHSSDHRFW